MPRKYPCYVCSKNWLDYCIYCEVCHLVIYFYTPRRVEHIVAASSIRPSVRSHYFTTPESNWIKLHCMKSLAYCASVVFPVFE